jgi:hypothetical protein
MAGLMAPSDLDWTQRNPIIHSWTNLGVACRKE